MQAQKPTQLPNLSVYRLYAPVYDFLFGAISAGPRKRAVALLELQAGERLLISGVGTGLDLPLLPPGVEATGVDISTEMLAQARKKAGPAKMRLAQMDAQRLDFEDNTFDVALLALIVSVAPDGRAVFQEAWRVLKPGGRMVLFDKFAPERGALSPVRRIVGGLIRLLGTDVTRRLSDILGDTGPLEVEIDEPSLLGGQYRVLRLRKG